MEHAQLHEERLRILEEVKSAYKQQEKKQRVYIPQKSAIYEHVIKREKGKILKEIRKSQKKRELIEKRKKYGEYVKQVINAPQIDSNDVMYYTQTEGSDYDEDIPVDDDLDEGESRSHRNRLGSNSQKKLTSKSELYHQKQQFQSLNEEAYGRTVRDRKQLHSVLRPGDLLPLAKLPKSRVREEDSTRLFKDLRDPNSGSYSRNIKSEYK